MDNQIAENQIAELRRQLAEEKSRREAAEVEAAKSEARATEEQTRREEEQTRREEEQRRREEEQRRREEEQRRREEEQRRREEEQRRREAAEVEAEQSKPKNLIGYLQSCHDFSRNLQVVTDKTLTTQGDTTKPSGRLFPKRIVPWDDFPRDQEKVWGKIAKSHPFKNQRVFPSQNQMDYVQKNVDPISSELGLRHFARDTVENPVRTLVQEIHKNLQLREQLQLDGTFAFESHTNLGTSKEPSIEEEVDGISISESHVPDARGQEHKSGTTKRDKRWIARGDGRAIKGSADEFCIYQKTHGQGVPIVLVEYKPPHKLPLNEIITGLREEIRPAEEIINKDSDSVEFLSKSLLAAVVTQLFSAMIGKGVRRGYIFTGEALIFLGIPDDPSSVQYHLSIPHLDFQNDDENRYHRTSVAQITAFALDAVAAKPPSQSWYDTAADLDIWAVEYIDILKKIPETIRKAPFHSAYKASRWQGFSRSPIRTRSRHVALVCNEAVDNLHNSSSDDEGEDNEGPPTPTPKRAPRIRKESNTDPIRPSRVRRASKKSDTGNKDKGNAISRPTIGDYPYCTHQCLLGLASGKPLDKSCPNFVHHRGKHLPLDTFRQRMRTQLAQDRGPDADCQPLYIKGSRGALVKVRLSSHGYTLVAKAMKQSDHQYLLHEASVYSRLNSLQGSCIPVSLGWLQLELPYYYDHGIYVSMLLLSWAGRPLFEYLNLENKEHILNEVDSTLRDLHLHRVLHKDVEPRNWVWDGHRLMLIDFERAVVQDRVPLQILSPNRKRKRRGEDKSAAEVDEFTRESQLAKYYIARWIALESGPTREKEILQLKEDIDFSKQCLNICREASNQVSSQKIHIIGEVITEKDCDQVVVTTLADLFNVGLVKAAESSMRLVGLMEADTLRKMSEDRYGSRFNATETSPGSDDITIISTSEVRNGDQFVLRPDQFKEERNQV